MVRASPLLVMVLFAAGALAVPPSSSADAHDDPIVVAVLDTGIRATHQAFASGQVVAWYDFGRPGGPAAPTETWDPRVEPYDDNGHGTAVASLVGGTGAHTPSHAPGVLLAVAKISAPDGGAAWSTTKRAIVWAVDVAKADIISLSFYAYTPQAGLGHDLLEGLEYARSKGVLPIVLAGNGMGNFGLVPTVSWAHPPASSPHALVVGGADTAGTPQNPRGSLEPEVTARYGATVACPGSDTCYTSSTGTSFSTPLVAGMAAALLRAAAQSHVAPPSADYLETLLKRAAGGTAQVASLSGYGFLDAHRLTVALGHVTTGTYPPLAPDATMRAWHVENVQQLARWTWYGQPERFEPWTP